MKNAMKKMQKMKTMMSAMAIATILSLTVGLNSARADWMVCHSCLQECQKSSSTPSVLDKCVDRCLAEYFCRDLSKRIVDMPLNLRTSENQTSEMTDGLTAGAN